MPVKRKAYTTPQIVRAKRPKRPTMRKRMSKSRLTNKSSFTKAANQHIYTRYAGTPADISTAAIEYNKAESFTFNSIKAYSEFSALYDRYRITSVQMQVTLINNPDSTWALNDPLTAGAKAQVSNWFPKFWYVKDYDDANSITLSEIRERSKVKCMVLRPNKLYKINIRPAILNQTYATIATTGYSPHWKQWIDMKDVDVPHYGLKWVLDMQGLDPNNDVPYKLRIEYKYFFTCKDVL